MERVAYLWMSLIVVAATITFAEPTPSNARNTTALVRQFLGKWQLVESKNFDKYMEAVGIDPLMRKIGNMVKPLLEISFENGKCKVVTDIHGLKTVNYEFVLNKEFDELTPDGRSMKSIFKLRTDGKLIQHQRKIKPQDKDSKFTRYIKGDKLICLCEAEGVQATRIYQKVTERS